MQTIFLQRRNDSTILYSRQGAVKKKALMGRHYNSEWKSLRNPMLIERHFHWFLAEKNVIIQFRVSPKTIEDDFY